MKKNHYIRHTSIFFRLRYLITGCAISALVLTLHIGSTSEHVGLTPIAKANSVYFNMSSGNLNFSVNPANVNQITANNDWSGVNSVEGYFGQNLTPTHGVNPQTVLNTEFALNQLPNTPRNVSANKGNPSAFNAGGLAEFDSGTYLAIGFQGNVQANPYLVFYLNTTGRSSITLNYVVQDIDAGSNDAVSPIALQYRIGETGLFTNVPAGYIADATDGGIAGRTTNMSVVLPTAVDNKPQIQVRLITTNAANAGGSSTPDEWVGVNNFVITSLTPSAASVNVGGRVTTPNGRGVSAATVTMYDAKGRTRNALTSSFGYFSFPDVEVGTTYYVMVASKRYSFTPRTVTVLDELTDVDFVGDK